MYTADMVLDIVDPPLRNVTFVFGSEAVFVRNWTYQDR